MAAQTDGISNGYTFLWKIQNKSHCWWLKMGEVLESPKFVTDTLEGTKWSLNLYPMGSRNENYVGLFLMRNYGGGPSIIEVNYKLAFLGKDGSVLKEITIPKRGFKKGGNWGMGEFEKLAKVFFIERQVFLPDDTLTVQCTIWNDLIFEHKQISARSVFKENRKSFMLRVNKFSTLQSGLVKKFKGILIDFDLVLNHVQDYGTRLLININSFDESIRYFSIKTSILDSEGETEDCGIHEYLTDDFKKGDLSAQLFYKNLIENKMRYLPNDVLTLDCESIIWNQIDSYECCKSGGISPELTNAVVESKDEYSDIQEKSLKTSELLKDLKSMYNDGISSDMELRTLTQTFKTHKSILNARSPVFKNMFSTDMKEMNCGYIDIADFEDDTVHRMLLYMYTDAVEDLQFETALKLYTIADKYQILSLRARCSSFLKENLCPTNACDVLVQSDLRNDDDLKSFVFDYILGQHKDFFRSQEWKDFMNVHYELAHDVMYKKICRE